MDYQPLCIRNVVLDRDIEIVQWVEGEPDVIDMDVDTWISEDLTKPLCPPGYPLFPIRK